MFTLQSIGSLDQELAVVEDLLTGVVDHEGTTSVTSLFASVGIGKSTFDRRHVVVVRDMISREHIALFENHTGITSLILQRNHQWEKTKPNSRRQRHQTGDERRHPA